MPVPVSLGLIMAPDFIEWEELRCGLPLIFMRLDSNVILDTSLRQEFIDVQCNRPNVHINDDQCVHVAFFARLRMRVRVRVRVPPLRHRTDSTALTMSAVLHIIRGACSTALGQRSARPLRRMTCSVSLPDVPSEYSQG